MLCVVCRAGVCALCVCVCCVCALCVCVCVNIHGSASFS